MNQAINIELIGAVPFYLGFGIKIITAVLLGGMVGYDREIKMKSAGIKTNMMICLGATLYTAVSLIIRDPDSVHDPNRAAAQIVSGIGFLGAGAIIQGRGGIVGLTTAATMWVVAAIGVTIGAGYPIVAFLFTVTILAVLKTLPLFNKVFEKEKDFKNYHLEILSRGRVKGSVKQIILNEIKDINEMSEEVINVDTNERILNTYITLHPRKIDALLVDIKSIIQVEKVKYHLTEYTGKSES
ncbi:MAG: MgtC/SapB family protein [Halobacteriovoraceae bacterium]|jgi:putative Mg2+ transporter-C (MgtC) family protein|nr:MgtC/SapB family protein [Halobacteriovoraceae bacterium]MBT5093609.1 MgtC/SapB family protein [Halobacteriovoraceae bacterium]